MYFKVRKIKLDEKVCSLRDTVAERFAYREQTWQSADSRINSLGDF
jgi:hypothetical protein